MRSAPARGRRRRRGCPVARSAAGRTSAGGSRGKQEKGGAPGTPIWSTALQLPLPLPAGDPQTATQGGAGSGSARCGGTVSQSRGCRQSEAVADLAGDHALVRQGVREGANVGRRIDRAQDAVGRLAAEQVRAEHRNAGIAIGRSPPLRMPKFSPAML
jgi:hypothetical protein